MRAAVKIVGLIIAAVLLGVGIMFATGTLSALTAPFRGHVEQVETVNKGDYRIASYDSFYDQCMSVQADEDRINNLEAEAGTATESRKAQLGPTITAVQNSRAEKIREYNADAAKEATRGQFRDSGLPHELDVDEETACSVE